MRPFPASAVQPGQLLVDERLAGVAVVWWRTEHPSGVCAVLVNVPGHGPRQLVVPPGQPVLAGPPPAPEVHGERILTARACAAAWLYLRRRSEQRREQLEHYASVLAEHFGGSPQEQRRWLVCQAVQTAPYPQWEPVSEDSP